MSDSNRSNGHKHSPPGDPVQSLDHGSSGRPRSVTQAVTTQLRQAIVDGRFAPGAWMRQEELARAYGVSRVPIRQALHALAAEGWVTLTPYAGARVLGLSLSECVEIYLIRERLEPLALAQSIPHLTSERIETLRRLLARMEEVGESDRLGWFQLDTEFHLESIQAVPLPRLLRIIESLWERAQQYRRTAMLVPESIEHSQVAHRLLMEAIERPDPGAAEQLLAWHIGWTRQLLIQHTDLFTPEGSAIGRAGPTTRSASHRSESSR